MSNSTDSQTRGKEEDGVSRGSGTETGTWTGAVARTGAEIGAGAEPGTEMMREKSRSRRSATMMRTMRERRWKSFSGRPLDLADILEASSSPGGDQEEEAAYAGEETKTGGAGTASPGAELLPGQQVRKNSSAEGTFKELARSATAPSTPGYTSEDDGEEELEEKAEEGTEARGREGGGVEGERTKDGGVEYEGDNVFLIPRLPPPHSSERFTMTSPAPEHFADVITMRQSGGGMTSKRKRGVDQLITSPTQMSAAATAATAPAAGSLSSSCSDRERQDSYCSSSSDCSSLDSCAGSSPRDAILDSCLSSTAAAAAAVAVGSVISGSRRTRSVDNLGSSCYKYNSSSSSRDSFVKTAAPGAAGGPVGGREIEVGEGGGVGTGIWKEVGVSQRRISGPGNLFSGGRHVSPRALRRVPSSLFYIDYDDDDDDDDGDDYTDDEADDVTTKRRRLPRDMPTSRKMSAVQYCASGLQQLGQDPVGIGDVTDEGDVTDWRDGNDVMTSQRRGRVKVKEGASPMVLCYEETMKEIDRLMVSFRLSDETYSNVMTSLNEEMERGLARSTNHLSTVKMYPTYVRALPDGTECGRFIALDLGGTNFRVLLVDLKGTESPDVLSKVFLIPMRIMLGPGFALFDHIVACIAEFLSDAGLLGESLSLGFTFSFPCSQDGLNAARLVRWTKGFKCSGVEGENVVQLLQDAIDRRGDLRLSCVAIINDNVGVLMTGARADNNCNIGLILGTGTNCCYMENLSKVELWDGDMEEPRQVIINTEWGAFGDNGSLDFVRNRFDRQLDIQSLNSGHQLFEKMISGMYMGEIVRLVLCELAERRLLFRGKTSEELNQPNLFYTKYISEIESDGMSGEFTNTRAVLQELDLASVASTDDCRYIQHVCWQVSQRAAHLAAAAVATVINRLSLNDVTVAVDGSLYRFHPHFKDLMSQRISRLVRPWQQFKLTLAHDGSGQGAALVAAVAQRQIDEKKNRDQPITTTTKIWNEPLEIDNSSSNNSKGNNNNMWTSNFEMSCSTLHNDCS